MFDACVVRKTFVMEITSGTRYKQGRVGCYNIKKVITNTFGTIGVLLGLLVQDFTTSWNNIRGLLCMWCIRRASKIFKNKS